MVSLLLLLYFYALVRWLAPDVLTNVGLFVRSLPPFLLTSVGLLGLWGSVVGQFSGIEKEPTEVTLANLRKYQPSANWISVTGGYLDLTNALEATSLRRRRPLGFFVPLISEREKSRALFRRLAMQREEAERRLQERIDELHGLPKLPRRQAAAPLSAFASEAAQAMPASSFPALGEADDPPSVLVWVRQSLVVAEGWDNLSEQHPRSLLVPKRIVGLRSPAGAKIKSLARDHFGYKPSDLIVIDLAEKPMQGQEMMLVTVGATLVTLVGLLRIHVRLKSLANSVAPDGDR